MLSLRANGETEANLFLGGLVESLVCYDRVVVQITNDAELLSILRFFDASDDRLALLNLLRNHELVFLNRNYMSGVMRTGRYFHGVKVITEASSKEGRKMKWNFVDRVMNSSEVRRYLKSHSASAIELKTLAVQASIEEEFDADHLAYENVQGDFFNRERCTGHLRRMIEADSKLASIDGIEDVKVHTAQTISRDMVLLYDVDWAVPEKVKRQLEERGLSLPCPVDMLNALSADVTVIQSASRLQTDIWTLPTRTTSIIEKIAEASAHATKIPQIVDDLIGEVEFPDLGSVVTRGKLDARTLMEIRAKAGNFRTWLQSEANRDRNAALAYMTEAVEGVGLSPRLRKTLRFAGVVGGAIAGTMASKLVNPASGPRIGALVGSLAPQGIKFLLNTAASLDEGWKPAVFGKWLRNRVLGKAAIE